jgi:hypothetical protein
MVGRASDGHARVSIPSSAWQAVPKTGMLGLIARLVLFGIHVGYGNRWRRQALQIVLRVSFRSCSRAHRAGGGISAHTWQL